MTNRIRHSASARLLSLAHDHFPFMIGDLGRARLLGPSAAALSPDLGPSARSSRQIGQSDVSCCLPKNVTGISTLKAARH